MYRATSTAVCVLCTEHAGCVITLHSQTVQLGRGSGAPSTNPYLIILAKPNKKRFKKTFETIIHPDTARVGQPPIAIMQRWTAAKVYAR